MVGFEYSVSLGKFNGTGFIDTLKIWISIYILKKMNDKNYCSKELDEDTRCL